MKKPAFSLYGSLGLPVFLLLWSPVIAADGWLFSDRMEVPAATGDGIFHHLEGAGRKHIAVSKDSVAVTWEDNSPGSPQVFIAFMETGKASFSDALQLSRGSEAYEPSVAGMGKGRFIVVWEQDARVHAAIVGRGERLTSAQLSTYPSGHASVDTFENRAVISWREQRGNGWFIQVAVVDFSGEPTLHDVMSYPVEQQAVEMPVQLPSVALGPAGIAIAWEDRREGHTRMLFSHSSDGKKFLVPDGLNEFYSNRTEYDMGNGSTRVSIAAFAEEEVLAAWMDKRRGGGYGIFAALGSEGGASFGPNEKVHGEKGDRDPHTNPSTAGNRRGDFAIAWDDYRNGDSDIWISFYDQYPEWSEDLGPAVAGGPGEQTHPSITLDDSGDLHMVWMEKQDMFAPGRLWYSLGTRQGVD